jgi:hypothetical protein
MSVWPSCRLTKSMGMPAASASVANVCRIWYSGRRSTPARSSAGYQTGRRQFERLTYPPSLAGKTS